MILIDEILQADIEYKDEVLSLSKEAENYLGTFEWCDKVIKGWLVDEFGYMLCIFYFKIESNNNSNADDYVWVIVGDLPIAYIDVESAKSSKEALECYCDIMQDWVDHVKIGRSIENCFPVDAPADDQHANMLLSRIELLRTDFIPALSDVKIAVV